MRLPAGLLPQSASGAGQGVLNGRQNIWVFRKAGRILLRNDDASNPHGELTPPAFDEVGIEPCLLLDQRRHTGGARQIISNLAVADADRLHRRYCSAQPSSHLVIYGLTILTPAGVAGV